MKTRARLPGATPGAAGLREVHDTIPPRRRACRRDTRNRLQDMPSELLTERVGAVLVLTLSDPATRNTLSKQAIVAGIEALNVSESDPAIRSVVLRGDGEHFCAGGNLHGLLERRRSGPAAQVEMLELLNQFVEALRACPKPSRA
jgi:enoyl-CoA hydratase/carnithine racemase